MKIILRKFSSIAALLLAICLLTACSTTPSVTPAQNLPDTPVPAETPVGDTAAPEVAPQEPEAPAEATIAGLPVSKITIIYPAADSNGESAFAREIGSAIAESYGVTVPVLPDSEAVREESKLLWATALP